MIDAGDCELAGTSTVPASRCPTCRRSVDRATDPIGAAAPKPGDFSICWYCQSIHVFTASLRLRLASAKELAGVPLDILSRMQRAITTVKKGL